MKKITCANPDCRKKKPVKSFMDRDGKISQICNVCKLLTMPVYGMNGRRGLRAKGNQYKGKLGRHTNG